MQIAGIRLPPLLARAARECRPHVVAAGVFSLCINLLYLAPAIYMLQVYDRVVPTGGVATLAFITLALAIALLSLSALDSVRLRLLVRASLRLDALVTPKLMKRALSQGPSGAQAIRDFDTVRTTIASPAAAALLDVPWLPIFIIVSFLLHFWIGVLAIVSAGVMLALAWANQRLTRPVMEQATATLASAHNWTQAASVQSDAVRALGMHSRIVDRGLRRRSSAVTQLALAQFAGSKFTAAGRFLRQAMRKLAEASSSDAFTRWANESLEARARRHGANVTFWRDVADAAPAMGMCATVLGLVRMFAHMTDPALIGAPMATALVATLWGILLANLIAGPVADRLERLSEAELAWQRRTLDHFSALARSELDHAQGLQRQLKRSYGT